MTVMFDLWTNNNPTNPFESQTITLKTADYKYYEVIYYGMSNWHMAFNTGKIPKGTQTRLTTTSGGNYTRQRDISSVTETTFTFGNGITATGGNPAITDNKTIIPYKIIGYK